MTTVILLAVVAIVIAGFSYFTNAGFGDRKPADQRGQRDKEKETAKDQASAPDDVPPPHK